MLRWIYWRKYSIILSLTLLNGMLNCLGISIEFENAPLCLSNCDELWIYIGHPSYDLLYALSGGKRNGVKWQLKHGHISRVLTLSNISYSHQVFSQVSVSSQTGNILGRKKNNPEVHDFFKAIGYIMKLHNFSCYSSFMIFMNIEKSFDTWKCISISNVNLLQRWNHTTNLILHWK